MVVGHPGDPGRRALGHVAVEFKLDSGHVPILLQTGMAIIVKECLLSPSYATQTVVQVRGPSCLKHKC